MSIEITESTEAFDLESAIAKAAAAKRERDEQLRREQEEREHKAIADAIGRFSKSFHEELPREMTDALGVVIDYDQKLERPQALFERHGEWVILRIASYSHWYWRVVRPDHFANDVSEGGLLTHLLEMIAEWGYGEHPEQPEPEPAPTPAAPAEPQITILEDYSYRRTIVLHCDCSTYNHELMAATFHATGAVELWCLTGENERPETMITLQKTQVQTMLAALSQWQAEQVAKTADDDIPF